MSAPTTPWFCSSGEKSPHARWHLLLPSSPRAVPLCLLAFRGSHHPDESLSSRNPSETPYIIVAVIFPRLQLTSPTPLPSCSAAPSPPQSRGRPGPAPPAPPQTGPAGSAGRRPPQVFPAGAAASRTATPLLLPKILDRRAARMPPAPAGPWYKRCQAQGSAVPGSGRRH